MLSLISELLFTVLHFFCICSNYCRRLVKNIGGTNQNIGRKQMVPIAELPPKSTSMTVTLLQYRLCECSSALQGVSAKTGRSG